MPNHTHLLSAWRLSGSCLANHQKKRKYPKVRAPCGHGSIHHHWFEYPQWKARAVGWFDLDEELGLGVFPRLRSQPLAGSLAHSRRAMRGSGACAKLSIFSAANTCSVSENVLHRVPIGKRSLVLNKHAHSSDLARTSHRHGWGWSQGTCILTCSPIDSVHLQAWESRLQVPVTYALWTLPSWVMLAEGTGAQGQGWQRIDVFCTFSEKWNN